MDNFNEKRLSPRVNITSVSIEVYSFLGDTTPLEMCEIIDISETGIRFASQRPYSCRQVLRLTFTLPRNNIPIRTNAIVIHTTIFENMFHIGTQFKSLSIIESKIIKNFIEKRLSSNK